MATVTHATMHHDHRQWQNDNDMRRCDIAAWQEEIKTAAAELKEIEAAIKEHESAMQVHAAAIRLRQQELMAHEHALVEYQRGETRAELISLAQAHDKEATKHKQQLDAHERTKRHHHTIMAQLSMLRNAVAKPM